MRSNKRIYILLIVILIVMSYFYICYKSDIKLMIKHKRFLKNDKIELAILEKSSEFLDRRYTNVILLDNYFDRNCFFNLENRESRYKEIRSVMSKTYGRNIIARGYSQEAKILYQDDKVIKSKISGELKILHAETHQQDVIDINNSMIYEYEVTFEKKFLFVWKAIEFNSSSEIIEKIILDTIK